MGKKAKVAMKSPSGYLKEIALYQGIFEISRLIWDCRACLLKLRQFAETLAQLLAARSGLYQRPEEGVDALFPLITDIFAKQSQIVELVCCCRDWRRRSESNRRIKVLQTSALPLGYAALSRNSTE
jgi:hypothetical protein